MRKGGDMLRKGKRVIVRDAEIRGREGERGREGRTCLSKNSADDVLQLVQSGKSY